MGSKGKKAPAFNHEDEFPLAIKREYFQAANVNVQIPVGVKSVNISQQL